MLTKVGPRNKKMLTDTAESHATHDPPRNARNNNNNNNNNASTI